MSKCDAIDNSTIMKFNGVVLGAVPLAKRAAALRQISDTPNTTGDHKLRNWAQDSINKCSATIIKPIGECA